MTKKKHYPEPNQDFNFAKSEEQILKFWQENKIFEKSISNRDFSILENEDNDSTSPKTCCNDPTHQHRHNHQQDSNNEFVFYDGPPFANGLPHYGHLLTGYIKDIFARYQTMKGKKVERKFGWDTHGLPVEMEVEKELGVSGQIAIKEFGIEKFNDACQKSVMKYAGEWENYVSRQGRWVDFKDGYKTMDVNYMESVLWAFKKLHNEDLMYEDYRVVPYSWACQTPLSNFETRMDNSYRQKESKAVTVKFEVCINSKYEDIKSQYSDMQILSRDYGELDVHRQIKKTEDFLNKFNFSSQPNDNKIKVFLLAWTTTPWTLPSNLALAVGKNIDYVAVRHKEEILILAEQALAKYKTKDAFGEDNLQIIERFTGNDLVGLHYDPLFPYFTKEKILFAEFVEDREKAKPEQNIFRVLSDEKHPFITTEDGTGIVHLAPGFGEDDQIICKKNGIHLSICPVDEGGKFTSEIFDFEYENKEQKKINLSLKGRNVLGYNSKLEHIKDDPNAHIIKYLNAIDALVGNPKQYLHNYPHCWRTDTPLIYKAVPSWYVKVTKIKDQMVANNQQINWIPDNIKDGQFGKWLEGARDWSISRNRFWGCPVPVWRSDRPIKDPTVTAINYYEPKTEVFGSLEKIKEYFGHLPRDENGNVNLHRPYIDSLTKTETDCEGNEYTMRRVTDVLDCWFESGSMPFAQAHYPFENKDWFEKNFPADFITEYLAQTRGWFYTLMVLSTALFKKPPFKNVICHGTILDEHSQKLSKRLKNYADPLEIFSQMGSDAMRFYMISQPVMKGQELRIDKEGKAIKDTLRIAIKPLINAYNFFCLYANSDGIKAEMLVGSSLVNNIMDRYILAKLKLAVKKIDAAMQSYDTPTACNEFVAFFEVLNNWYIRRSRQRFWKSEIDEDKTQAYNTLYSVLITICEASAPLLPFTTEKVWKDLKA